MVEAIGDQRVRLKKRSNSLIFAQAVVKDEREKLVRTKESATPTAPDNMVGFVTL